MSERMKIAVMGSGGVGGLVGGRLATVGADVHFVARGRHLDAMRQNGLTIESDAHSPLHVPQVSVTDEPATIGVADYVLIAVKLWETEAAGRAVASLVGPHTAVLSLQNGVIKDDILKTIFAPEAVMGGAAYMGTSIARPGVIRQIGPLQRVVFGEYDGQTSPRAKRLLEAMLRAGLQAELSTDIRRALWEKYAFLVGLSACTASMRTPIGPIRSNPQTRAFLLDVVKEAVAVARALGVNLPADYAEQRVAFADTLPPDMTSSLHHDLEHGGRLEVEWLSGGVVQLGKTVNVPTPCNRAVWDILALHANGKCS
jgi:2-dehydropantoate 2-reductase